MVKHKKNEERSERVQVNTQHSEKEKKRDRKEDVKTAKGRDGKGKRNGKLNRRGEKNEREIK